ncbi:MAG: hypothetical protein FJX68_13450 [Alphaproteobacteria bacterium]|nr:hypothetical protein [Alphaproteobacteria bacterium]
MIGMRMGAASHLFQAPEAVDLRLKDGKLVLGLAAVLPQAGMDFCGRQRRQPRTDLGAIDYGAGPCDVAAWQERLIKSPWRR